MTGRFVLALDGHDDPCIWSVAEKGGDDYQPVLRLSDLPLSAVPHWDRIVAAFVGAS